MLKRFSGFTIISGFGWLLDFAVMASLVQAGLPVFAANFIGAFCGVTFVFFVAGKRIFQKAEGRSTGRLLLLYWIWQAVAVTVASAATAALAALLGQLTGPALEAIPIPFIGGEVALRTVLGVSAKILVTPATLVANFLFMRFLLEGGAKAKGQVS